MTWGLHVYMAGAPYRELTLIPPSWESCPHKPNLILMDLILRQWASELSGPRGAWLIFCDTAVPRLPGTQSEVQTIPTAGQMFYSSSIQHHSVICFPPRNQLGKVFMCSWTAILDLVFF